MSIFHFLCIAAAGESHQLVSQADGKDGDIGPIQLFQLGDHLRTFLWISGTIGQHNAIRLRRQKLLRLCLRRIDNHLTASPKQASGDIKFCPNIKNSNLLCHRNAAICIEIPRFVRNHLLRRHLTDNSPDGIVFNFYKDGFQIHRLPGGDHTVHRPLLPQYLCQGTGINALNTRNPLLCQKILYTLFISEIAAQPG